MKMNRLLSFSLPFLFLFPFTIAADQAIIGTESDGNLAVVFPTPDQGIPNPTQNNVTGLPAGSRPHGVTPAGPDRALVADFPLTNVATRIFVVRLSDNSLLDTINTPTYNGTGTIAVNPALTHALACGLSNTLTVIQAPFTSGSLKSTVILPGLIQSYQTQAIVFNPAGRAFAYNTAGISILDPPYSSILFTIPYSNANSGAIAISPDGNKLLVSNFTGQVGIFTAPFSASSTPQILQTSGGFLDGIMASPDGQYAIVGDIPARVFVIYAPFSSSSLVEKLKLPSEFKKDPGFEDVAISSDSQLAILTGNSTGNNNGRPALFLQGPFGPGIKPTAKAVNINGGGRGDGAVRFIPENPDFSLECVPGSFTSVASVDLSSTCSVRALGGFANNVNLSCTGVPAGFSCGFGTNPVTPTPTGATSALTIVVGAVAPGDYNFNVRATDGSIIRTANIAIKVVVPVFQENFQDGNADGWELTGGEWAVVPNQNLAGENLTTAGNALQGTVDGKGSALSPDFNLGVGTVEADVVVGTPGAKVSLLAWFTDKKNLVEFQILEAKEKFILKQKGGGASGKQVFKRTIDPNKSIHIKINFNGNKFDVFVDGSTVPDISMPAVAQPNGKVGLQIKSDGTATASITNVIAY